MFSISTFATTLVAIALLPSAFGSSLRRLDVASYQAVMGGPVAPFCYVEHGFDYVGNDLTNVPGNYDQCCDKCAAVANCAAWSWTNQNGGTCWLKYGRGEIVVNANVKSALFFRWSRPTCEATKDIDYVGNDIVRVDGASVGNCCDACHKTAGCRAYTWSDHQGGSCWLKSKVTQIVTKPGAQSALTYPDTNDNCTPVQPNYGYVGNDIGSKPSPTPEGCCSVCRATDKCTNYSWTKGTCYLMSETYKGYAVDGVYSGGVRSDSGPRLCTFEADVDYVENNIGNALGKDASECCAKCRGYNGCKAWSWSNYNGGTCWLKSGRGDVIQKQGVISGSI